MKPKVQKLFYCVEFAKKHRYLGAFNERAPTTTAT